jgi:hypothetical protein
VNGLKLYKNDLHFIPGELHPLHPAHMTKFGLTNLEAIKPKETLITLCFKEEILLLIIWEKE